MAAFRPLSEHLEPCIPGETPMNHAPEAKERRLCTDGQSLRSRRAT